MNYVSHFKISCFRMSLFDKTIINDIFGVKYQTKSILLTDMDEVGNIMILTHLHMN